METILVTYGLKRSFLVGTNRIHALSGIDISCPKGKLIIIRGRSGSGKTTLINIIGGLDRPDAGQVIYRGADIHSLAEQELTEWRRKEVGFVFQSFALMPHLTALENVELPQ
ncbi:MAG TPA: ATP-binding cassette domain-containing protein, partial [Bacillota bacterium]|nr:ATP-binding cassette domain-containing protein [Bacillota bacterium]